MDGSLPVVSRPTHRRAAIAGLSLITCALFFSSLHYPLLEPEEARYAEIPRQMLAEGRLLTPVLHGEDYYQKPPLLYWLVMCAYSLFGVHDWAARLVPAIAGILTVLVTAAWGARVLGFWTGLVSGVMLALSARYVYLAGMLSTDGLLCLCVIAALAAGQVALTAASRAWWLLSALACGLGVLAKGPVAVALVLPPLVAAGYFDRCCRAPRWRGWTVYAAVVGLVAGPWFVAVAAQAPGAFADFVWVHHVLRFLAPVDHEKPAWFYLPSILLGALPWTLLLAPAFRFLLRRPRPAGLHCILLAVLWCLAFFSLSGCKRPAYILPAFALLALILGTYLTHGAQRSAAVWRCGSVGAAAVFLLLLAGTQSLLRTHHEHYALRSQIVALRDESEGMPVGCYPKRWDSVSFYLQRDIQIFRPGAVSDPAAHGPILLFVKRETLPQLGQSLPQQWEFAPCGQPGNNVVAGVIQKRAAGLGPAGYTAGPASAGDTAEARPAAR
jgi:4-amino-4-deoxy-L-arabinose transferase-like glycosyltransferase